MPSLRACLETLTWQTLKAITRAPQLQFRSDWTKVEIRQRWLAHLGRRGVVRRLGARLAKEEREALAALLAHDGCLPYASFSEQFGCITPYRPWRPEGPSHPWRRLSLGMPDPWQAEYNRNSLQNPRQSTPI